MEKEYLSEENMLPSITLARFFDTRQAGIHKKTGNRKIEGYELGIYLGAEDHEDGINPAGTLTINQITYKLGRGDVRFLKPGDIVCSEPPYQCYTAFFALGDKPVVYYNEFLDSIPSYTHSCTELIKNFEKLTQLYTRDIIGIRIRQNAILLNLLSDIYQLRYSPSRLNPAVQKCLEFMKNHLNEKITLEVLGKQTGYSPLHVLRLFQNDTNQSPHDILSSMRMAKAKELLNNTEVPVCQIACMCGFSSESHFQTLFKQTNNLTPGAYRKAAKILL